MDIALDRIRTKISELEEKLVSLKIAERELLALDQKPGRKASAPAAVIVPSDVEPAPDEGTRQTIGRAITEVLEQHGALTVKDISEQITASGRDINNRAISFSLQAMKKRGLVKSADGAWKLAGRRSKRT